MVFDFQNLSRRLPGRPRRGQRSPTGQQCFVAHPVFPVFLSDITTVTAVDPVLSSFDQRLLPHAGIEMNVATECPEIRIVFDLKSLVSSMKEMPCSSVAFSVPMGVTVKAMLHIKRKIGLRCFQQQVNVVWHPTVCQNSPIGPQHFCFEPFGKSLVVPRIVKQFTASVATCHNVINRTEKLAPPLTCHHCYSQRIKIPKHRSNCTDSPKRLQKKSVAKSKGFSDAQIEIYPGKRYLLINFYKAN